MFKKKYFITFSVKCLKKYIPAFVVVSFVFVVVVFHQAASYHDSLEFDWDYSSSVELVVVVAAAVVVVVAAAVVVVEAVVADQVAEIW